MQESLNFMDETASYNVDAYHAMPYHPFSEPAYDVLMESGVQRVC